jgi:hypothetical protein
VLFTPFLELGAEGGLIPPAAAIRSPVESAAVSRLVHSKTFVAIATAAAVVGALAVSPALGGPRFLTLSKARKVFISKKGANARFLDQGKGDARYLQPQGEIRISAGPSGWILGPVLTGSADAVKLDEFADSVRVTGNGSPTERELLLDPALPGSLYGRQTKLAGVELCYNAGPLARLADADLGLVAETDGASTPPATLNDVVNDTTERTDGACRTFTAPQPVPIGADEHVVFALLLHFTGGVTGNFFIGRTTFLLQP